MEWKEEEGRLTKREGEEERRRGGERRDERREGERGGRLLHAGRYKGETQVDLDQYSALMLHL